MELLYKLHIIGLPFAIKNRHKKAGFWEDLLQLNLLSKNPKFVIKENGGVL